MTSTNWLNVRVQCRYGLVNEISDDLEDLGAVAVSIAQRCEWLDHEVTGLFDSASVDADEVTGALSRKFNTTDEVCITHELVEDRDWVRESQRRFEPLCICDAIWIKAPWHQLEPAGSRQVVINPGMSFGTGHHATTKMCLELLTSLNLEGKTIIDYGCGSGILAISALVLGASYAYGIDIDPDAVAESHNNARINAVDSRYSAFVPTQIPDELTGHVVLANLSRNVLIALKERLTRVTASGGCLALTGILSSQVSEVQQMFAQHFEFQVRSEGEWVLLTGRKR